MKKILLLVGITSVIVLTILGLSQQKVNATEGAGDKEAKETKETIYPVDLESVTARQLHSYVNGTATLAADRQVDIFAKLAGQISELAVEEGGKVAVGDVLLVLDGDDARLALAQAAVNLREAKADFSRTLKSFQKALISEEDYDKKRYVMERIEAEYQMAEHKLKLSQVVAPFAGTVVKRNVELGQTVQPSDKLFTLAALNPLKSEVYLPESQVVGLRPGMPVRLSRDAAFNGSFAGRLERIAPVVDRDTGTVKVTITATDPPAEVRPGTYIHLNIVTKAKDAPAVISNKALVYDGHQNTFVFISEPVADQPNVLQVRKIAVVTGVQDGGFVEITSGLRAGDRIVLTGKDSLKEGSKVRDAAVETGMAMN